MSGFSSDSARRTNERLCYYLGDDLLGLLAREGLSELSVNQDHEVFVSISGNSEMQHVGSASPARTEAFCRAVASSIGKVIDVETDPTLAAEMPKYEPWYRARIQITAPPAADGWTFTMRMHARRVFPLGEYVLRGILSPRHHDAIIEAIRDKLSILVVGGTESGKTTFLNAIICATEDIYPNKRLLIIEKERELQSTLKNTKQISVVPPLTMMDMVMRAMRERPDELILGEVVDKAAAMLVRAQNTGHDGGKCTIHSGSPRGGLQMLESYISQSDVQPTRAEIASAINMICFIAKDRDHPAGREVKSVVRVSPQLTTDGDYQLDEV